jgi:hypothetical protein
MQWTVDEVKWIARAEKAIPEDEFKIWMVGGGVGGIGVAALLNPVAGAFLAGASFFQSWNSNEEASNHLAAIDDGIMAHLFDGPTFDSYVEYRGPEQVLVELNKAKARKLPIKAAGRKFLNGGANKARIASILKPLRPAEPAPVSVEELPHAAPVAPVAMPVAPMPTMEWDDDPEPKPEATAHDILRECLAYPAVLIYGPQGSGKSTLAKWFINERMKAGHMIEVLDPHAAYGAWKGLPVSGAGMDYAACNERLQHFAALVKARYTELAKRPEYNPKPLTVVTEEFTNWSSHCPDASAFFASSMSDIRKIAMHSLFIAHGRTLTSLGGKAGVAAQRDQSLLEIEMLGTIGEGGKAVPTGYCNIYYPGQKDTPIRVAVPNFDPDAEMVPPVVVEDIADLILAILEKHNAPMLASEVRQQSTNLKKLTTENIAFALDRMATDHGTVASDGQSPARFTLAEVSP